MMTSRKVLDYVTAEPFRPFRVRMASGQSFDIRHPEMILVGRSRVRVYTITDSEENEKWHDVSMMLMETIEPLDTRVQQANVSSYQFMPGEHDEQSSELMNGTPSFESVELPRPLEPRPEISHVLFDFDGTLSVIRQGWPEVMVPMFVEALPRQPGEAEDALREMVLDDIMRLNGKQTIYQMIQLTERIRERGGEPNEPLWYKHEYLRRLDRHIGARTAGLADGTIAPDDMLVHAARPLLEHLRRRGLPIYLASGTDEFAIKREADLLDITRYFDGHIYGALDDYRQFSKKIVIDRIIQRTRYQRAAITVVRRRLRRDREHQACRRPGHRRRQRRGPQRLRPGRRLEATPVARRGRRRRHPRLPRRHPVRRLPARPMILRKQWSRRK